MMTEIPQREQVLRMLEAAGPAGVHSAELRRAYIGNPSQRISELEKAGYLIAHERQRSPFGKSMGTRYFLVYSRVSAGAPNPIHSGVDLKTPGASAETLFEVDNIPPAFAAWLKRLKRLTGEDAAA